MAHAVIDSNDAITGGANFADFADYDDVRLCHNHPTCGGYVADWSPSGLCKKCAQAARHDRDDGRSDDPEVHARRAVFDSAMAAGYPVDELFAVAREGALLTNGAVLCRAWWYATDPERRKREAA